MSYRICAVFKIAQSPVWLSMGRNKAAALKQAMAWARNTPGLARVDVLLDYQKRGTGGMRDRTAVVVRVRPTRSGVPKVTEYHDPTAA